MRTARTWWPRPQSCGRRARGDDAQLAASRAILRRTYSACPLRLVLSDDLIRCSTELGFADGDRVAGCSDLIRVPSERLWVEWNDMPRKTCLEQIAHLPPSGGIPARRAGVLIRAHPDGRSGEVRTFWSAPDERVYCAALVAEFDLDTEIRATAAGDLSVFDGGFSGVALPDEPAIDALLGLTIPLPVSRKALARLLSSRPPASIGPGHGAAQRARHFRLRFTHAVRTVSVDGRQGWRTPTTGEPGAAQPQPPDGRKMPIVGTSTSKSAAALPDTIPPPPV